MNKKIKVLQFSIGNVQGGVTQYVLKNWEFIDKDVFHFDFVTLSKTLDFGEEIERQGCKIHYISCYAEENETQFINEMEIILSEGYDVIHLHTNFWRSFIVEELAIKHGVPKIIVHSHNTMIGMSDKNQREEALKMHNLRREQFNTKLATDFWACSELAADWLYGEHIPRDRIKIMNNAIDVEDFSYDTDQRDRYRLQLGLEDCFVIGHTGRFAYQKNHEFLVDMFHEVSRQVTNARLLLIGTGEMEKGIQERILQYGLTDKVMFMGKRDDVNGLLQAMDLFVLPSRFEGLPIVLIEAQASGIRCVSSDTITREAKVTPNVEYIPLEVGKWMEYILRCTDGYERKKADHLVTQRGFNIRTQIKELERMYST